MAEQRRREFREGETPAVNIFETLDRETQEQLRAEQERWEQDRREFRARNGERYTVGERVEARLPGATINNNWRPATITRVGRLVVRNNSSTREMDRQESGVRDPATQQTGETANLRVSYPVEIQMLRNRWVPGILISKNYSVQFDGADNIVPLTSEDIRRPQGQAPAPQAPQAPQAQAPQAPAPQAPQAQAPQQVEEDYTVGERVEAQNHTHNNWYLGTIDRIGGYEVRYNANGRIRDKQRNEVRDPTSHRTGELTNLRVGSPVEIKVSDMTWVPGTLLKKYYIVRLDVGAPIMASHTELRRPGNAPVEAQAVAQAPAPAPAPAPPAQAVAPAPEPPAPAVAVAPQQIVDNGNYYPGQQVELEVPLNSNNWIPGTITNFKSFGVRGFGTVGIKNKETGLVKDQETESTNYTDMTFENAVSYRNRINDTRWYGADLIYKQYDVSYRNPQTGALITNRSFKHNNIRRPQGQAPAAVEAPAVAPPQRQLPQPTAVEPNPPYQPGENVECLADDPNTGRGVWNPAVIRAQALNILSAFIIANEQTGRVVERTRTDVYSTTGRSAANYVRIGDTVMYDEPRVRGIVMDKIYYVSYTNTRGQRLNAEKRTGEIRRFQAQAAQPAPAVRPPLPQPTEAVAFEIHNAFDSFKFEKFMDIVRKNSNFKNRDAPLKPLIDNINANPNLSPEKKTELAGKIERIFTTLRQYSNYDRNINNIMDCIQYVLMQPQDFIDIYIDTFITDCLKAYSTGRGDSCIKGMYERVYFAFRDTVSTICLDQIQGTGAAPLCKPEYIEIFNCFYEDMPTEMLNDYAQQWFQERGEAAGNFSEENRIEDFVGFVRSKVNNVARFRQAERSVRRYAATNINVLFGGRRKRSDGIKKARKTVKRRKNKTMKKRGNNIRNNSRNKQRNKKTRKH